MSRQWLKYLLIFSLSINMGGVAAFLYSKYWVRPKQVSDQTQLPPSLKELVTFLNLNPEQSEMFQKIFTTHRQDMRARHQEINSKRKELLALLKSVDTSWSDFQAKLEELRDIQFQGEEASLGFLLKLRQHLKPEQREVIDNFMECRLLKGQGEKGEWCKARGMRHQGRVRRRCPVTPSLSSDGHGKPLD
jgi:Spy/CpxP family protein refolding chaperone